MQKRWKQRKKIKVDKKWRWRDEQKVESGREITGGEENKVSEGGGGSWEVEKESGDTR